MSLFRKSIRIALTLSIFTALVACGSSDNQEAAQQAPAPVCPACPPPPEVSPPPSADDLLGELADKILDEKQIFLGQAKSAGVSEKVGTKSLSPDDFGKMATFLWSADPQLRIAYLRAMEKTNQLIETVKPIDGSKFDPLAPAAEPDQDISDRIGEVIVDWALFQRMMVDDLRTLGIENVMPILPQDDFPQANQMMKDLLPLVMPPPEPGVAEKAIPAAMNFFISDAYAQDKHGAKLLPTAKLPPSKYPAKATAALKGLPTIKTVTAPLLLARTMSFRVGNGFFVLESPLQVAQPQFTATPVEQYTFKLEKKFIGDAYFNEVAGRVTTLANIPQRTQPEWMQMSLALTELDLLYRMINPNFGEAPAIPETPPTAVPPTGAAPSAPGATAPTIPTTPLAPGAPVAPTSPSAPSAPAIPVTPPSAPTAPAIPAIPPSPTSGGTAPSGAEPASPADRPQPAPSQAQPTTSADRPSLAPSSTAPTGTERPLAPQGSLPTDPNAIRPSTQPAPAAPVAPTAP